MTADMLRDAPFDIDPSLSLDSLLPYEEVSLDEMIDRELEEDLEE